MPKRGKIDFALALITFILVLFGLVMISSASVVISYEKFGYNYYYFNRQLISLGIGILAWLIFTNIDYRLYQKYANTLLILSILLLIAVFIPGLGKQLGGASRWIHVGPLFFQPSEVVKLTFILYLCAWLEKKGDKISDFFRGFLPYALLVGMVCLLIILEPDMGTMSVILATSAVLLFIAGAKLSHLAIGAVFAFSVLWLLIKSAGYRLVRFLTFLNPKAAPSEAIYHISQALLAVGSGGLLGLGFGQSRQKYLYLPQAHTDSIFAIIAEELGFLRASLVIVLFVFWGLRGLAIAKAAPDKFSKLVATGITSWFILQVFVNLFAMLGILPLTGVPLPFISYGGSSLVISLVAVGILLNISKHIVKS